MGTVAELLPIGFLTGFEHSPSPLHPAQSLKSKCIRPDLPVTDKAPLKACAFLFLPISVLNVDGWGSTSKPDHPFFSKNIVFEFVLRQQPQPQ